MYSKKMNTVQTKKVNSIFAETEPLAKVLEENKKDNLNKDCLKYSSVTWSVQFSNHFIPDLTRLANLLTA